jgi:hypothetical protein
LFANKRRTGVKIETRLRRNNGMMEILLARIRCRAYFPVGIPILSGACSYVRQGLDIDMLPPFPPPPPPPPARPRAEIPRTHTDAVCTTHPLRTVKGTEYRVHDKHRKHCRRLVRALNGQRLLRVISVLIFCTAVIL